jgi:hypothetical protein
MTDARSYVYLLFRLDGTPLYVGKGKGDRWLRHARRGGRHPNLHLRRIILAAQAEGKELPVIKLRENLTDAQALEIERCFIAAIGREANGGPLVNLTDGGEIGPTGYRYTPEQRESHGAKRRGRKHSPEWRAAISAGMPPTKTPEHIAAAAAGQRGGKKRSGWWSTEEGRTKHAANNPGHTGCRHSAETIKQIKSARFRQEARIAVKVSPAWANQNSVRHSAAA